MFNYIFDVFRYKDLYRALDKLDLLKGVVFLEVPFKDDFVSRISNSIILRKEYETENRELINKIVSFNLDTAVCDNINEPLQVYNEFILNTNDDLESSYLLSIIERKDNEIIKDIILEYNNLVMEKIKSFSYVDLILGRFSIIELQESNNKIMEEKIPITNTAYLINAQDNLIEVIYSGQEKW
jgi:DNA-binding protein YbaB